MEISQALLQDFDRAFEEFAQKPTQSGRIKLRGKLKELADTIEVEAYQHEAEEQQGLFAAAKQLRELSENVLVAPVSVLLEGTNVGEAKKETEAKTNVKQTSRSVGRTLGAIFNSFARKVKRL